MNPALQFLTTTPHPFSILPGHPSLDADADSRPSPASFLHTILSESDAFLTSIPHSFHRDPKPRSSPSSTAPVKLSTRTIPENTNQKSKKAFWACRTSVHEDAPVVGSAAWDEFRAGLRVNHVQNEMDYTPSVSAVDTLMVWPEVDVDGWRGVEMQVNLITHTFHPTALIAPRTFLVLAISADRDRDGEGSFVTVQIPLAARSDTVPAAVREKIAAATSRRTVFASYASVERVCRRDGRIEWTMATTSEAGGSIPQWVQRSWTLGGVPKAIVADVGLFIGWTAGRRVESRS
ncbi:hypothetical protein BJX96DRAFT_137725 [Aspergillus floccosus]